MIRKYTALLYYLQPWFLFALFDDDVRHGGPSLDSLTCELALINFEHFAILSDVCPV